MAILKITQSGFTNFTGDPPELDIDEIIFDLAGGGSAAAVFNHDQFGEGLISDTVIIDGGQQTQALVDVQLIQAGTFSAAGWSFKNFQSEDKLRILGNAADQTIIGSKGNDFIFGGAGGGGVDHIDAGEGNDEVSTDSDGFEAGTTIEGGANSGGFDKITIFEQGTTDIRPAKITGFELLDFFQSGTTAIVGADQIGTGGFTRVEADFGNQATLEVRGSDVDLRGVTQFNGWNTDDIVRIVGTSTTTNILFGSSQNDKISGTAVSSDLMTGGGGLDTMVGGRGVDNFRYFAGSEAVAGEIANGGLGTDNLSLFNTGAIDFSLVNISGVEGLDFVTGNSAAILRSDQIGGTAILSVSGSAGVDQITVNAVGQSADLSKLTFNTFTDGTDSITINGSALQDVLTGSSKSDTIDGKAGNDAMSGGGGDDVFRVGEAGDTVSEALGQGLADKVIVTASYVLTKGAEVELLTTNSSSATVAIDLTGNELVQEIFGNAGVNTLNDGGVGASDTLRGFGGNDTYRVFNSGDVIIEASSQGVTDRVTAAVDYTLGKGVFIELFTTNGSSGTSAIDLTGNEVAQDILGNAGDNRLEGKGGADSLRGFGGADSFTFATALGADNIDTIVDFNVADDRFLLSDSIFTELDTGTLSATAFRANTTGLAQDASDRIIYETDTGKLFYDEDGTGALAGIQFATITANLALTNADFSVA
jgi:Ca2+-binding RTX toxin-like protein